MPISRLDVIYRKILLTQFFTKGWGSADSLIKLFEFKKVMANRETCSRLVPPDYPISIINEEVRPDCKIIEGKFRSPFAAFVPGLVPPVVQDAYFQMVLPLQWPKPNYKPICIHFAGTGDHFFWRRRNLMVKPLLKDGIGAIILENPYYGLRKPYNQIRSSLHYVSDIFVMGGCLILECQVLLHWCEQRGFGPLGVSGLSMGGHMASLAAANWPKPLVLVPCLSWSTASSVFTEGVMSESIDWDMLQMQYLNNDLYCDTLSKTCRIVDSPFACTLSQIPEFDVDVIFDLDDTMKSNYVTPYEILRLLNRITANCQAVPYKHSSRQQRLVLPPNLLKEQSLIFGPSRKLMNMRKRDMEAIWFMRGMMDEFTHLKNFSVPYDTSLIIAVCAKSDGYVPRTGVSRLEDVWPGSTVKYIDTGHVGAYLWHRKLFRECIRDAFEKAFRILPSP